MKRIGDDEQVDSELNRRFRSFRGENYGQSEVRGCELDVGGGGRIYSQHATANDALAYLREVKTVLRDQKEKYDMFLGIMKDFKAQRTNTQGVIARVKNVFKGHNNLILGFNTFLPKDHVITLDEVETPQPQRETLWPGFQEARSFVDKIKERFQSDEGVYQSFLGILFSYRKEKRSSSSVSNEVAALFRDHPDLLEEFRRFLPDASVTPANYGQNLFQRYSERSSGTPALYQAHNEKQHRQDTIVSRHPDHDLGVHHPEMDYGKTMIKMHKGPRRRLEKDSRDRRIHERDDREPDNHHRDFNLQHCTDKRKSSREVEGFGAINFSSYDDRNSFQSMYNYGINFCEKVEEKLDNEDDFQTFLKCLNMYSKGIISRSDLQNLIADILGEQHELMAQFSDFFGHCENIDGFLSGFVNKKSLYNDGHSSRSLKICDKDKERKHENDGAKEKERCRETYIWKSIQELDLSNCQSCTPSYRLLPNDYLIPPASQRTKLGHQVLNDHWVSVTSGSEDYSFKHMRKNQYEESLFRCEDDRYELDMLLECVTSTAKRAEQLLNSINDKGLKLDAQIHIEDYFTVLNLRCIERIYGDHGLDVMEALHRRPSQTLPVILTRLKQKVKEWTRCHSEFKKVWAEVYAKNHNKSLDHRSFYFKQQDSRSLSTKYLVAEIRDLREKKQDDDNIIIAFAAGNRHPLVKHLEYKYSKSDIHEDLYKLVQYSSEEFFSSKEQFDKVIKLWTMFLEPLLGLPSRACSSEVVNDVREIQGLAVELGDRSRSLYADATRMSSREPESTSTENENTFSEVSNKSRASANDYILDKEGLTMTASSPVDAANMDCDLRATILPSTEGGDTTNSVALTSGTLMGGTNFNRCHETSIGVSEVEKEEGELSPDGSIEVDNFVIYGEAATENNGESRQYQCQNGEKIYSEDAENVNNANTDDEGFGKTYEAGAGASGSESAGDASSKGEHEEEENIEPDQVIKVEAAGLADRHANIVNGMSLPSSEHLLLSSRPLSKHASAVELAEQKTNSLVFYGNDDFYVLFRLHQVLYERILSAKSNLMSADMKARDPENSSSTDPYARFVTALHNLLNGSVDNTTFEDECRALIGNQSYVLFTLDKLIYKLLKQLHTVASDEVDNQLLQLYTYEQSRKPGKVIDSVYYENARALLHEANIYRLEFSSAPLRLSIQMMDDVTAKPEVFAIAMDPNSSAYLHDDFLQVISAEKEPHGITLCRNKQVNTVPDEASASCLAMEDVKIVNGLECMIDCSSSKTSYVWETEDIFFRPKRKRKNLPMDKSLQLDRTKVGRFRKFISASL